MMNANTIINTIISPNNSTASAAHGIVVSTVTTATTSNKIVNIVKVIITLRLLSP